ncbi:phosphotransferase [Streptomyces sp. NA02950]|uniref:phosphotransferase family protein n=1 Tax=Streptomyces sp. NA02950 TaxID=2742137 RepID=UPI00159242DF|nr:phosphotransferase [Streptomyces sp. NA02950]QKV91658.1 phosphotransferase [Streptomyces sp. NA02950]
MSTTRARLADAVRRFRSGAGSGAEAQSASADVAVVLADRADGTVVRCGPVAAKAHAPDADPAALAARLRAAAHPRCAGVLLAPLAEADTLPDGRRITLWPYGEPVAPDDPEAAPWAEAGTLLARLHTVPPAALPGPLPPMRGPAKAARAVARLRAAVITAADTRAADTVPAAVGTMHPAEARTGTAVRTGPATATTSPAPHSHLAVAAREVERAWAGLPGWARGEGPAGSGPGALCHGDFHLGQLVRHHGRWLLIDVDDLGLGDPAWDLARPAAWYAAGLLAPGDWARFLGAYRAAGGRAAGPDDPWPRLEVPAGALTVQTAALALAKAAAARRALDEAEEAMVDGCVRIARLSEAVG